VLETVEIIGAWAQGGMIVWCYVLLPIIILAGSYVFIKRSPHVNFGIARELEQEGKLPEAIKYYKRVRDYAGTDAQRRVAGESIDRLTTAIEQDEE